MGEQGGARGSWEGARVSHKRAQGEPVLTPGYNCPVTYLAVSAKTAA